MKAVIMTGGRGVRLRPLTDVLPKPLLPLDGMPIVEILIRQLTAAGFDPLILTTGYGGSLIRTYLGDGRRFGGHIVYVEESRPLGTAGSLRQVESTEPLLVVNGDILTTVPFRDVVARHHTARADMTIVSYRAEMTVDFGVLQTEGDRVIRLDEKPHLPALVSAGIYVLSPAAREAIPDGPFDMTDLIHRLLAEQKQVVHYPWSGLWIDIGREEDLYRAQRLFAAEKARILPGGNAVVDAPNNDNMPKEE
ncbi:MAG: NTP transferase domain-containing protein [Alicyclobacillaceae bacterium]|nr:NTP transferase domain-containing protein [Alicyclobacillaceae bacterium]